MRVFEVVLGALFLASSAVFMSYAMNFVRGDAQESYQLKASFSRGEGLVPGVSVQIAGIKVGTVTSVSLDPENFVAVVSLAINSDITLFDDTKAKLSSNLFSSVPVITLIPGFNENTLSDGDRIRFVDEQVSLEDLVGKFLNPSQEIP